MGKDQTVPYGTDSLLDVFQAINCPYRSLSPSGTGSSLRHCPAINCLATIVQSLRDKVQCVPPGWNLFFFVTGIPRPRDTWLPSFSPSAGTKTLKTSSIAHSRNFATL